MAVQAVCPVARALGIAPNAVNAVNGMNRGNWRRKELERKWWLMSQLLPIPTGATCHHSPHKRGSL